MEQKQNTHSIIGTDPGERLKEHNKSVNLLFNRDEDAPITSNDKPLLDKHDLLVKEIKNRLGSANNRIFERESAIEDIFSEELVNINQDKLANEIRKDIIKLQGVQDALIHLLLWCYGDKDNE